MVAECGDIDLKRFGSVQDTGSGLNFMRLAVNLDIHHCHWFLSS
jgi:hypothetical protein